jgi:hypothetical protein
MEEITCPKCGKTFPNPLAVGPFVVAINNAVQCPDPECSTIIDMPDTGGPADFKLSDLRSISGDYKVTPRISELTQVCEAFATNMHRVIAMGMLPSFSLYQFSFYVEHARGKSLAMIGSGSSGGTSISPIVIPFDLGADFPDALFAKVPHDGTRFAIESMLASMVLGTWTAFETLAADLWVRALNVCPAFAGLSGIRRRISDQCEVTLKGQQNEDEGEAPDVADEPPDQWLSLK